jgi:hypothetical protein
VSGDDVHRHFAVAMGRWGDVVGTTFKSFFIAAVVTTVVMGAGSSIARVGVTSETNGDPLGKPPSQAERVLRVGIDIQANEVIRTKSDDRAHVVFLDGTSLTIGPSANMIIDKFVYDPAAKKGELAMTVSTGVFRLVGGKISKTSAIVVTTPSASIGIRGGIGLFVVDNNETKANFLFGISMAVAANGQTQTAIRPGSQVVTKLGGIPGAPVRIPDGSLSQVLATLEGRGGTSDGTPDQKAKASGFSSRNSEQGPGLGQSPSDQSDRSFDRASQAISNATEQSGQATVPNAGGGSAAVGTGSTQSFVTIGPSTGPISGPTTGPLSGPPPGATPAIGVGNGGLVPAIPASTSQGPPPPSLPPPLLHGATPAIGVGNGGLVPAIPASPSQGRR